MQRTSGVKQPIVFQSETERMAYETWAQRYRMPLHELLIQTKRKKPKNGKQRDAYAEMVRKYGPPTHHLCLVPKR